MFTPRYIKHSKLLVRHAQKYLRYKRDILEPASYDLIAANIRRLRAAIKQRDRKLIETHAEALDAKLHELMPVTWESHWRENCEVILVAIVVAVGIRSYFLQPFKIPTGSMQPTLDGIIGYPYRCNNEGEIPAEKRGEYEQRDNVWYLKGFPDDAARPNFLRQVAEFVLRGRNYINVVSNQDDEVLSIERRKFLFFFTFSRIQCKHQTFDWVYCPPEQLIADFKVSSISPENHYAAGQVIARGAVDTGDQVFVDKFSYNFVKPHRGDVFVFRTKGIPLIGDQTQFYIKRLAGLPGDTLKVNPPLLYVNGSVPSGYGFKRVMSGTFSNSNNGYRGYGRGQGAVNVEWKNKSLLVDVSSGFRLPEDGYFAMGDNSYNSSDSRYWGPVPERNLVGRGLFVYWPFIPHWGLIR